MRDALMTGYAPKLVAGVTPEDRITVATRVVYCDNGGGALGHPQVALRIEHGQVTCPYCSRTFVLAADAAEDHGH
ncbi:zinc-finger domain-containing protein [Rhodovarius crocodyli]|uniref:Zinc-finger domain-containing protein n=1 Tax=Rhodovarius crocodyli TaxID=1979269 RepID=A0A437M3X3_9PROT|nr:zinc-finger domain-containing protein [Rhodovarius crocodyli]RVT92174.1 zinc-finger domain-containing protein [Rhodovarius crocodyli]